MIEQKTITFYDATYYWYNESVEVESTSYLCCREDCYISALHYFGYPISSMTGDDCYDWSEDELESIAREWGVVVDFVS